MAGQNKFEILILGIIGATLILGAFAAVPGLYNIDELIYYLGADALARDGGLTVRNGFETYGSEALRLWFLVDGPNGLAPQYPVGSTALGAPLLAAFGMRGLFLLNAIAAAAALLLTRQLALRLHGDPGQAFGAVLILLFGSFFIEYAFGIWPHMLQTAFVLAALWAAVGALSDAAPAPRRDAFLAGLFIGLGMLVRLDTVLLLPAIGAMAILYAPRPVTTIGLGALGLLPGLLAGAAVNAHKFGTWNPISYGATDGGGIDVRGHLAILPVLALLPLVLIACRQMRWRAGLRWPLLGAGALGLAAMLVLPQIHGYVLAYLRGMYTLVIDLVWVIDWRPGVEAQPDGTLSFWGLWKKALGQSLPWLGALTLLAVRPWGTRRRGNLLILLVCLVWTLPFAMRTWHGGLGTNMRYFLPLLPLLSILLAGVWADLRAGRRTPLALDLVVGLTLAVAAVTGWILHHPSGFGGAQQILPVYALAAMAALGALAGLRVIGPRLAELGLATCFWMALIHGLGFDLTASQLRRQTILATNEMLAAIPGPTLFNGPAEIFAFQAGQPDGMIAGLTIRGAKLDLELINRALADGYRVFAVADHAARNGLSPAAAPFETPAAVMVEITAADLPG